MIGFTLIPVLLVCSFFAATDAQRGFCQQDTLQRCTDPLKVLTNNRDLGFATTKEELNSLCPKLIDGLRCIDNFTGRCLDAQHREFFHMLYAGTKQVIVDLCQEEDYQREYLSHAPCMRVVQSGYEACAIEYQSHIQDHNGQSSALSSPNYDDAVEHSQRLCCSFQNYMKCSQAVVEATCGLQTASFTRGFLDTMAGPLIQGYCLSYEADTYDCEGLGDDTLYAGPVDQALDRVDTIPEEEGPAQAAESHSGSAPLTTQCWTWLMTYLLAFLLIQF